MKNFCCFDQLLIHELDFSSFLHSLNKIKYLDDLD